MKILYILRGLPGSGKSTLAKSLSNALTGHIEADMFFVDKESGEYRFDPTKLEQAHKWCKETVEKWMGPHGLDTIIVSNTFNRERELTPYFELAEKYGYVVFSLIVENRHGGVNKYGVPEKTLARMENRLRNSIKLR